MKIHEKNNKLTFDLSYDLWQVIWNANEKITELRELFFFKDEVSIAEIKFVDLKNILHSNIPDWVLATTIGNKIYLTDRLKNYDLEFKTKILLHEYIHVAMLKYCNNLCPIYLDEGIAMYFSGQTEEILNNSECTKININQLDYANENLYLLSFNLVRLLITKLSEKELIKLIMTKKYNEIEKILKTL